MAKRNSHSFKKLQKELKPKKKENERLERRQGRKAQGINDVEQRKYSN